MNPNTIIVALLLLAAVGITISGAVPLIVPLIRSRRRAVQPPKGTACVFTGASTPRRRKDLVGTLMLVAVGTFGLNQLQRLLNLIQRQKTEDMVGSILIIENDSLLREKLKQHIPAVFHDRMVLGSSPAFAGGMANKSPQEVMSEIGIWGGPIQNAAVEAVDLHGRRTGQAPGNILVFLSLGGQASVGLPALDVLHEQFAQSLTIGFTALPKNERLRKNYALLKDAYEERGVYGWVLTDNLGSNPVTADYGMVAMIVALTEAALDADRPVPPNNTFSLALPEQRGGVLIYQLVANTVPASPLKGDRTTPPRYCVETQAVTEEISRGLNRIERGKGVWSADLPNGEAGTTTFDIVMAGLAPDDLLEVRDQVTVGCKLAADYRATPLGASGPKVKSFDQANHEVLFASIATDIDPTRAACPVVVVRLVAVRNGTQLANEIVKLPGTRQLPAAPQTSLSQASVEQTNGVVSQQAR